jgi:phosphate transport system substrate-binding protein
VSDQGGLPLVPTLCTVKTEEYVLTRRLYLYTSTKMKPDVSSFIEFATGKTAWPIVESVNLVSLDPTPRENCGRAGHSQDYTDFTRNKTRLATNFHFVPKSDRLDTKAHLSMRYLADLLSVSKYHNLMLLGFTDDRGSYEHNKQLAVTRSTAVRDELSRTLLRSGVRVSIDEPRGLGAQDFLAPNDTPEGRERNRRVEVWVY